MTTQEEKISIIKVQGSDKKIYNQIGPLVMNPLVLALNDGYPFKNTDDHLWYIALNKNEEVAGFLSVVKNTICNDCTLNDRKLLAMLIKEALSDMPEGTIVRFVAHIDELPLMEQLGFEYSKPGVKYFRMSRRI